MGSTFFALASFSSYAVLVMGICFSIRNMISSVFYASFALRLLATLLLRKLISRRCCFSLMRASFSLEKARYSRSTNCFSLSFASLIYFFNDSASDFNRSISSSLFSILLDSLVLRSFSNFSLCRYFLEALTLLSLANS